MSIDDNTSENTPLIKSRTGKFLRGIFDKKAPAPRTRRSTPNSQQEFMQVVPEPISWDEGEETNWDDDFVEAPQPTFTTPQNSPTEFVSPPAPPSSTVAKAEETIARSTTISVSIPRPKNIKYKPKDPNDEPVSPASSQPAAPKNETINLDIQRPKNIKYKTAPPVKASLPDRLLAPIRSLLAKISVPLDRFTTAKDDRPATIYIEQVPANGTIPTKKSWQLPSLGRENLRQILVIAGALFLAMTAAWAGINFWPSSTTVATTPPPTLTIQPTPAPIIQPTPAPSIIVSPAVALVEAAKNRTQALANLYAAGFIVNLELDTNQKLAIVTVGDLWFRLTPEQQQQVAQSLWQQAHNYQMSGLEVRGVSDQLLARSPFIGTAAVLTSR
jgi:hypothetical protein